MHFSSALLALLATTTTALPSLTRRNDGQAPDATYSVQLNITQNDIHHTNKPNVILDCPLNSLCYRENVVLGLQGIALINGTGTGGVDTDFVQCRLFIKRDGFQGPDNVNNPYGSDVFGYEGAFGDTNENVFQGAVCYMAGGFKAPSAA